MHKEFKKQLVINISIAVGIVGGLLVLILLLGFDISRRAAVVQDTRERLNFRFQSLEAGASLLKDADQANQEREFLNRILPIPDQLINFPKDINNLAKSNDVDMEFSFGRETASSGSEPGFIEFTMTAGGSFNNLLVFIRDIERSPYQVGFTSFNLVSDGGNYRSVINGKVFSQ